MDWFRKLFRLKSPGCDLGPKPAEIISPPVPFFVIFLDVETTGFQTYDRVVSFGAIRMDLNEAMTGEARIQTSHLIFDPIKKSHPSAEAVHGYDDWLLRHQDRFSDAAEAIHEFIASADLVVAHNAEFDFGFLNREFERCGLASPIKAGYCTLEAFRERWPGVRASLSSIAQELKLGDQGEHHNALKDAWLAMQVYFLLNQHPMYGLPFEQSGDPKPRNMREPPPRPPGPLPRRNNKRPVRTCE
jgi:DNA polymerase-3 subunit epsilon